MMNRTCKNHKRFVDHRAYFLPMEKSFQVFVASNKNASALFTDIAYFTMSPQEDLEISCLILFLTSGVCETPFLLFWNW